MERTGKIHQTTAEREGKCVTQYEKNPIKVHRENFLYVL